MPTVTAANAAETTQEWIDDARTGHDLPSPTRAWAIVATATISGAAYGFTWNVVTVALPHMMGAFGATPDQISWVMIAFIVGSALSTASTGWFANRFGKRRVFLWAGVAFGISLAGCAFAETLYVAVFWRFLQGISGAAMLPIGQAIAVNAFPPEKYSRATSLWAIGFVTSNVISPSIGGFLVDWYGWWMVFLVAVPVTLVFVIMGAIVVPDEDRNPSPMDWLGFGSLILGLGLLQIGLAQGERFGWLESPAVMALLAGAAGAFWVFLVHIVRSSNPFIPPALFLDRNFSLGFLFVLTMGGVMYLPMFFLPLMLDRVAGFPAIAIGMAMASRGIGSVLGLVFQSRYGDRMDPRPLLAVGCAIVVLSSWLMSQWSVDVTFEAVAIASAIYGLSAALTWGPLNRMTLSNVPKHLQNMAFPLFYLAFEIGGAIGTAIFVTVHTHMAGTVYALLGQNVTLFNENFSYLERNEVWDRRDTGDLTVIADEVARQAEMIAHTNVFLLIAIIFSAMILLIPLFRR